MNNDPSSVISFIICLILSIYWVYCFIAGSLGKSTNSIAISDNFDIGYIRRPQPIEIAVDNSRVEELELRVKQLSAQLRQQVRQKQPTKTQSPVVKQQQPKQSKPVNTVKVQELKKQQPQHNPFLDECVAALIALGYKDKVAKEQATSFLSKNSIKSVEEFVIKFFRK